MEGCAFVESGGEWEERERAREEQAKRDGEVVRLWVSGGLSEN